MNHKLTYSGLGPMKGYEGIAWCERCGKCGQRLKEHCIPDSQTKPPGYLRGERRNKMFSVQQKREIADKVQKVLRETGHPELPSGEIKFSLHVVGKVEWFCDDIQNNGAVSNPSINPHNEAQANKTTGPLARDEEEK